MEDLLTDIINTQAKKINELKEKLLIERIFELTGERIDLVKESQRVFPRIIRKLFQPDQKESYYWNDGSDSGKLVITFYVTDFCQETYVDGILWTTNLKYK